MKSALCAERLKVEDEEDTAIDFLRYYKSKDFDASMPITVRYNVRYNGFTQSSPGRSMISLPCSCRALVCCYRGFEGSHSVFSLSGGNR